MLLKRRQDLDTEFYDVVQARSTPKKKATPRRGSAKKTQPSPMNGNSTVKMGLGTIQPASGLSSHGATPMTMASSNMRSGEVTRQHKLTQQNSESGIRKFNASTIGESSSHQPKLPDNFMPERR